MLIPGMLQVPAVRLVNEALLAALATGIKNGILVDVGESGVSVTPIFEGFPVSRASQWESCGGGDMSRYLDHMLVSRTNEHYTQMVRVSVGRMCGGIWRTRPTVCFIITLYATAR